jgi:hypothetical protein
MFNLTICFGPTGGTAWALLFKTEERAGEVYNTFVNCHSHPDALIGSDDFGQSYAIPFDEIHGMMLEDLELVEQAHVLRGLAAERIKAKFVTAATNDPTIRAAQRQQGQTPVLTPFRGN